MDLDISMASLSRFSLFSEPFNPTFTLLSWTSYPNRVHGSTTLALEITLYIRSALPFPGNVQDF